MRVFQHQRSELKGNYKLHCQICDVSVRFYVILQDVAHFPFFSSSKRSIFSLKSESESCRFA